MTYPDREGGERHQHQDMSSHWLKRLTPSFLYTFYHSSSQLVSTRLNSRLQAYWKAPDNLSRRALNLCLSRALSNLCYRVQVPCYTPA